MTVTDKLIVEATMRDDGLTRTLNEVTRQAKRFGASAKEQQATLRSLDATATKLNVPLARTKEAFKGLAQETEDATVAAEHVGLALAHQAATGINSTAAAARELGDVLGGGTRALRNYDRQAKAAADAIDRIKDPAVRARLSMEALQSAIRRQNSALGRATAKWRTFQARLAMSGPVGAAAAKSLANLHVAVGALAVGALAAATVAWKKYNDSTEAGKIRNEQAKKAVDGVTIAFGKQIEAATGASKAQTQLSATTNVLAEKISEGKTSVDVLGKAFVKLTDETTRIVPGVREVRGVVERLTRATYELSGAQGEYDKLIREQSIPSIKAFGATLIVQTGIVDNLSRSLAGAFTWGQDLIAQARVINKENKKQNEQIAETDRLRNTRGKGIGDKVVGGRGGGGPSVDRFAEAARASKAFVDAAWAAQAEVERINEEADDKELARIEEGMAARHALVMEGNRRFEAAEKARKEKIDKIVADQGKAKAAQLKADALSIQRSFEGLFSSAFTGAVRLADALASATLNLKDLGVAAADTGADILIGLGTQLGEFAIKSGAVFAGLGAAFKALATNPLLLGGIAVGLVGAGLLLKKTMGSGSIAKPGAVGRADSAAGAAIERLGQRLSDRADKREAKVTVLQVGDRQMDAFVTDTVNDRMMRGGLSPAGGVL